MNLHKRMHCALTVYNVDQLLLQLHIQSIPLWIDAIKHAVYIQDTGSIHKSSIEVVYIHPVYMQYICVSGSSVCVCACLWVIIYV